MNERFVNIKVDREERPDVDAVYMAATTAMTGHGGWPMTVFLDHDGGRSTPAPTTRPNRAPGCRVSAARARGGLRRLARSRDRARPQPPR
jgi:hypothetical protein